MTWPAGTRSFWGGVLPSVLAGALCLTRPEMLAGLERSVHDVMARAVPTRAPSGRVLILDVDERSLATVGQWPWPRARMAALIERVLALGASVVALDVVFAEPERPRDDADATSRLAHVVASPRVVLGYAVRFEDESTTSPCGRRTITVAVRDARGSGEERALFHGGATVCNTPDLDAAAQASGFLNAAPDPDGILRRVPLVIDVLGRPSPSLALAAVSTALQAQTAILDATNAHTSRLRLLRDAGAMPAGPFGLVPLDGRANLRLRYRGSKRTFAHVSAADVLAGTARAADFTGRIVFVGTTALGTREVVATPLDTLFTGAEVQATVADNLLQQDAFYRPEHAVLLETTLLLTLAPLVAVVIWRWGALLGLVVAAGASGVLVLAFIELLSTTGMLLSPLYPAVALALTQASMTGVRLTQERTRADRAGRAYETSQGLMVQTLLALTEVRDAETGHHSRRVQQYTRLLATQLRQHPDYAPYLTDAYIDLLATLAVLHDIGKVGIPDGILNKAGPLTGEEFAEMRRHPSYGRSVLLQAERAVGVHDDAILALAKDVVYTHHEKWDGSGYPQGLVGTSIPIAGRIVALVDVYDALVMHRPYRKAMTHEEATAVIVKGSGTHFHAPVVEAYLAVAPAFRELSQRAVATA